MRRCSFVLVIALLAACGVEHAGPYIDLPTFEGVYQCQCDRDGGQFVVELCWDGTAAELERAIVENEPGVDDARCITRPIASCEISCPNTGASTCNAVNGCYCH